MRYELVFPMFALFVLTAVVLLMLLVTRVNAVRKRQVHIKFFRTMQGESTLPELAVKVGRHYNNLFEAPVLFYTASVLAMIVPVSGPAIVILAWVFVIARVLHAIIHIGPNRILPRMLSFALGWAALAGMWVLVVLQAAERYAVKSMMMN